MTLDWEPVDGAAGYVIERSTSGPDGPWDLIEIGEPEVRPVPHPPYTDTAIEPGREAWYRVAAAASVKDFDQPRSEVAAAAPTTDGDATATVVVDAGTVLGRLDRPWRPMIGSEHLSQLESKDESGGRVIGPEFEAALRRAHEELGVEAVRAHAILDDDLGTYREVDGEAVHDFSGHRPHLRPRARPRAASDRRAQLHAARPRLATRRRRCSSTAPSSAHRATGIAGTRSSATS